MKEYFDKFKNLKMDKEEFLVNFDDKIKGIASLLVDSPTLNMGGVLDKFGVGGIATIYDLARVKDLFHDAGKFDELRNGSVKCGKKTFEFRQYFQAGDYLGDAPLDHPASGSVILAVIEGVDSEYKVIPSKTKFATAGSLNYISRMGSMKDCGYIGGFEEINGLMVPYTNGIKACESYDVSKDSGYGTILLHNKEIYPVACRPCSWTMDLAFENNSDASQKRTIIDRKKLIEIIGE